MCMQTTMPVISMTEAQRIAKRLRFRELTPMCIIRFDDKDSRPSMLEIARRCKRAFDAELSPELEVIFVGLDRDTAAHLTEWRVQHHLHTLGAWTRTLRTLLAPGSGHCPNCGLMTLTDPVLYCSACGANPGTVFENAGGVFLKRSQ